MRDTWRVNQNRVVRSSSVLRPSPRRRVFVLVSVVWNPPLLAHSGSRGRVREPQTLLSTQSPSPKEAAMCVECGWRLLKTVLAMRTRSLPRYVWCSFDADGFPRQLEFRTIF